MASKDESKSKTAEPAKSDSGLKKPIAEQPKALKESQEAQEQAEPKARAAGNELDQKISESEFVSDDFQTTSESDLAEIQDGMRKLGIDSMTQQALATTDGKIYVFIYLLLFPICFTLFSVDLYFNLVPRLTFIVHTLAVPWNWSTEFHWCSGTHT